MALNNLRNRIDEIDDEILNLFIERMNICSDVAEFKKINNLPAFQSNREKQIINNVRDKSPDELKNSAQILFENIMDISKCHQQQLLFSELDAINAFHYPPIGKITVGCQGRSGAYSHIAAKKLYGDKNITFFNTFEDVFKAVEEDKIDFGILPIMNSKAGSVAATYELLRKYDLFIASNISVKVSHCLAAKKGTTKKMITKVYSHEQALTQSSSYIKENDFTPVQYANTALAADFVNNSSDMTIAAVCSEECAKSLGLDIIDYNIADEDENYTKFICISKKIYISDSANIISISLSLPHQPSALYRLLTKFSVIGLNLLRIESKPVASRDFDVIFYLDFEGSITDPKVLQIINALKSELSYFKFLGNYNEVK